MNAKFGIWLVLFLIPVLLFAQEHDPVPQVNTLLLEKVLPDEKRPIYFADPVLMDNNNYLWVAYKNGLLRYDGIRYEHFPVTTNESYPAPVEIKQIVQGTNNRIWCLTDDKLILFDKQNLSFHTYNNKGLHFEHMVPISEYECLVYCHTGLFLFKTDSIGVHTFTEIPPVVYAHQTDASIFQFSKDADGNIWIGAVNKCIVLQKGKDPLQPDSYTSFPLTCLAEKQIEVRSVFVKNQDILWLYAVGMEDLQTYIIRYHRKNRQCHFLPTYGIRVPGRDLINFSGNLIVDGQQRLWWSSFGNKIVVYDINNCQYDSNTIIPQSVSFISVSDTKNTISNNYVRKIFEDHTGVVWISTNGELMKCTKKSDNFQTIALPEKYNKTTIYEVLHDTKNKDYWIGTRQGLFLYNPKNEEGKEMQKIKMWNDVRDLHCHTLTFDKLDRLWIGTQLGLFLMTQKGGQYNFERFTFYPDASLNNWIKNIATDSIGNFWLNVGAHDPVLFNIHNKIYVFVDRGTRDNIEWITCDRTGKIWVADDDHKAFHWSVASEYDSTASIHALLLPFSASKIYADKELIFYGHNTNSILFYDDDQRTSRYYDITNTDNPFDIYSLVPDSIGRLWVHNGRQLGVLDTATRMIRRVGANFGVSIATIYADMKMYNNALIIPGKGRFYIVNTTDAFKNRQSRPRISKITFGGTDIFPGQQQVRKMLTIPYHDNVVHAFFSNYDYNDSGAATFSYKLEGAETDWKELGDEHAIRFPFLSAGHYTLRVKTSARAQSRKEQEASIRFRVLPPWWHSWWAWLMYGVVLSSVLFFLYRFQLQRRLEKQEAQNLREMDELKSRLYTNITHEFRTPLAIILGMAGELKHQLNRNNNNNENTKNLEMIERNGNALLHMVNQLLDLTKLENNKMELQEVQADVLSFLHCIKEQFTSLAATKFQQLSFITESDTLIMDFDPEKMQQIISNLLSNAIKFTPEKGEVVLSVLRSSSGRQVIIEVHDSGVGIPEEKQKHIFDRFYQVDDSHTRRGEGSGIGLALCKELTEWMGGYIEVKSKVGKGSVFSITFPIHQNAPFVDKDYWEEYIYSSNSRYRVDDNISEIVVHDDAENLVLVVEDNQDIAQYIQQCLQGKYRISHAANGDEGIAEALKILPDIIISDVMMPEKDGFELCAYLKQHEQTSHIPIVLLTAKATVEDRIAGLSHGADAYLSKPFHKAELHTQLETLIRLRKILQKKYSENLLPAKAVVSEDIDTEFIQKAIRIIHEHIDDVEFRGAQLARQLQMSESNLYRKLKALTDKSTAVFIRSVRLQQAHKMLQNSTSNISEIAYTTGFRDPAWFSRAFKKEFGCAPAEVRGER